MASASTDNRHRVVVWSTGGIGSIAASPGPVSSVDLPLTIPRNAFVSA